jgi:hypothetical protein
MSEIKIKKQKCKYLKCRKRCTTEEICCKEHSKILHTFEKPEECPICLEKFTNEIPLIPCNHWICQDCIINSGKNECPVCRTIVELYGKNKKKMEKSMKKREKELKREQENNDREFARTLQQQLNGITRMYVLQNRVNIEELRRTAQNVLQEDMTLEELIHNALYEEVINRTRENNENINRNGNIRINIGVRVYNEEELEEDTESELEDTDDEELLEG